MVDVVMLVKRRLLQYVRGLRGGSIALLTIFLILPYLAVYHGDGDPTQFTQTMVSDGEELDASEDKASLFPSQDQEKSLVELRQQLRDANPQRNYSATTIFPLRHLILAALTSRPPPSL
jgi:hypothetical protein